MRIYVIIACLLCFGCASHFQLGSIDAKPDGLTDAALQADLGACRDRAYAAATAPGPAAVQFMAGATLVGLPAGHAYERDIQRRTWADCMTGRGYRVTMGAD